MTDKDIFRFAGDSFQRNYKPIREDEITQDKLKAYKRRLDELKDEDYRIIHDYLLRQLGIRKKKNDE